MLPINGNHKRILSSWICNDPPFLNTVIGSGDAEGIQHCNWKIIETLDIKNELFIKYLKKAGKKSNVVDLESKNVDTYVSFQNKFRTVISTVADTTLDPTHLLCFHTQQDAFQNLYYYFIMINELSQDPMVYYYSQGEVPIGVNFRDDRTKKIGLVNTETKFTTFINNKTEHKFGVQWWKKIPTLLLLILCFPLWFPIAIIYYLMKSRN